MRYKLYQLLRNGDSAGVTYYVYDSKTQKRGMKSYEIVRAIWNHISIGIVRHSAEAKEIAQAENLEDFEELFPELFI